MSMKVKRETLWYVKTSHGVGIRAGFDEDAVERALADEVGRSNIQEVREASQADIEWVRRMGGRVP